MKKTQDYLVWDLMVSRLPTVPVIIRIRYVRYFLAELASPHSVGDYGISLAVECTFTENDGSLLGPVEVDLSRSAVTTTPMFKTHHGAIIHRYREQPRKATLFDRVDHFHGETGVMAQFGSVWAGVAVFLEILQRGGEHRS
jgi:hypothetical protein